MAKIKANGTRLEKWDAPAVNANTVDHGEVSFVPHFFDNVPNITVFDDEDKPFSIPKPPQIPDFPFQATVTMDGVSRQVMITGVDAEGAFVAESIPEVTE